MPASSIKHTLTGVCCYGPVHSFHPHNPLRFEDRALVSPHRAPNTKVSMEMQKRLAHYVLVGTREFFVIVLAIMRAVATLHDSLNFNQIIFYAINQQVAMSESEEETDRKNVFVSQTHLCPKTINCKPTH